MRVAYLLAASAIGGGNQSLLTLWAGLRKHRVTPMAVSPGDGAMVEACRERGIRCEVVDFHQPGWREPVKTWLAYRRWRRLFENLGANLVHGNEIHGVRSVCLATRRLGLPLVCHIRFPPTPEYARWAFRGLPKPDSFIFNSHAVHAQSGPELARVCPDAVQEVVHNAVDLEGFQPKSRERHGPLRVGIIANLSPIKGHDDFLAMARRLVDKGQDCEFWIVGDDITGSGYRDHVTQTARGLGLNGQVKFLGFRADIAAVINELDIVVSSSHYETFGRSLIEAMACERPVVATAVGGMPEVVADGKTGLLVPARNPEALAAAVGRLLDDDQLRNEMGRAGRERVETCFSSEAHAKYVLGVYQRLLTW